MKLLNVAALITATTLSLPSFAAEQRAWVGDPVNGEKLFKKQCVDTGNVNGPDWCQLPITDSEHMTELRNERLYQQIKSRKGASDTIPKLSLLEIWDVIAYINTKHLALYDFFPDAGRYLSGEYTIDKYGLKRIKKAIGKKLSEKTAQVFTFFDMPNEQGNLTYVPSEPLLLDELKKKYKAGYLVFLPFVSNGYDGQIGIAMDASGKITKLAVFDTDKKTAKLNRKLTQFEGQGKKGQKKPFKSRKDKKLAKAVFEGYLRAMETATMYDRDENERTWADE